MSNATKTYHFHLYARIDIGNGSFKSLDSVIRTNAGPADSELFYDEIRKYACDKLGVSKRQRNQVVVQSLSLLHVEEAPCAH